MIGQYLVSKARGDGQGEMARAHDFWPLKQGMRRHAGELRIPTAMRIDDIGMALLHETPQAQNGRQIDCRAHRRFECRESCFTRSRPQTGARLAGEIGGVSALTQTEHFVEGAVFLSAPAER